MCVYETYTRAYLLYVSKKISKKIIKKTKNEIGTISHYRKKKVTVQVERSTIEECLNIIDKFTR